MISYVLHHHHADHFEAMSWARENTRHPAFYQSIPVVTEGRTSPWFGSAIQWVDFQASERRFVLAFESDADALHFKMRQSGTGEYTFEVVGMPGFFLTQDDNIDDGVPFIAKEWGAYAFMDPRQRFAIFGAASDVR